MTSWQAASEDSPSGPDGALRAIGLAAVCVGVAALAAATFVLSYQGIRAVALQAGIQPRYARGYPLLIDAMLVIVLAAVLALRGAGLPSRMLAWLTLLVVLGAAAGADTLHATGRTVPHNTAVVTAAVLPWGLVFVAFVLLLAMLRHARLRRHASAALAKASRTPPTDNGQAGSQQSRTAPPALPVRSPQQWPSASIVPGFTSQLVSAAAAGAAAGAAVGDVEPRADNPAPENGHVQLAGTDQEAAAGKTTELATQPVDADRSEETGAPDDDLADNDLADNDLGLAAADASAPPALADEPAVQSGGAEPPADEPEPQTGETESPADELEPQTGEAEPPADALDPRTDETPAEPAGDDDDVPVFRRIRSSPTPPEG
jgi:hypothetical protein